MTDACNSYMTIFVILATRLVMVFLHTEKSNYPALLQQAIAQAGEAPKILLTDQALEYYSVTIAKRRMLSTRSTTS